MNDKERDEKYHELIQGLSNQKKEELEDLKKFDARTKTMPKSKKNKNLIETELKQRKEDIIKIDDLIKRVNFCHKDKWTPVPIYSPDSKIYKNEKRNYEIPESTIQVHLGKTDYNKPTMFLEVAFAYGNEDDEEGENILQEHGIELKDKNKLDFDHTFNFKVDKSYWKSLFKKKIYFDIYKKRLLFGKKFKGKFEIDLKELKAKCTYSDKIKIDLESKRFTPYIEVEVKINEPFYTKEYETIERPVFTIAKIYPSFKSKKGNQQAIVFDNQVPNINPDSYKKKTVAHKPQPKNNNVSTSKVQQTNNQPKQQQQQKASAPLPKPKNPVDKSELDENDIKDPGRGDLYRSLYCLQDGLKALEAEIEKIDGRTPRQLLQKKIKFQTMIQYLNENIGETIDVQSYKLILQQDLVRDKKLCDYFMQEDDKPKYLIVSNRYNNELKEFKELENVK